MNVFFPCLFPVCSPGGHHSGGLRRVCGEPGWTPCEPFWCYCSRIHRSFERERCPPAETELRAGPLRRQQRLSHLVSVLAFHDAY